MKSSQFNKNIKHDIGNYSYYTSEKLVTTEVTVIVESFSTAEMRDQVEWKSRDDISPQT